MKKEGRGKLVGAPIKNPLWKLDIETTSTGQKPITTTILEFRH
jgi:hypothetical protein